MNIKKFLVGVSTGAILLANTVFPVLAAGGAAPKATGGVGYTAYGLQRHAEFNAIQSPGDCTTWNVNGANTIAIPWAGTTYTYTVNFSLVGTTLTGTLSDSYYPTVNLPLNGTVVGNTITFTYDYPFGSVQGTRTYVGTIDSSGQITGGTWSDSADLASGTWSIGTLFVKVSGGCTGKGVFNYSDVNGNFYKVDVQYVVVSETSAWFAGPVISGNVGAGYWLFAKVQDNGTPGSAGDLIWGSFVTTEAAAKAGVVSKSNPGDGSFAITSGNLQVH